MVVGMVFTWAAAMRAKRAARLPRVAVAAGLQFSEGDPFNSAAVPFPLFREGDGRRITNMMWRDVPTRPRVFDYGYYTLYQDKQRHTYENWHWFTCALVQHNGKWPELRVTKKRLLDRAAHTLGVHEIELESEEFARTFVVLCDDPKFATDLLDPQVMQVVLDTKGVVDFQTRGRFLLLTTSHLEPEPMVGLLRVAERFVEHVPSVVWEVYGRFPDGMGTEDMPGPPPNRTTVDQWGLSGYGAVEGFHARPPFEFKPAPDLGPLGDAWDPTPDVDHDLDGRPIAAVDEDPWGEGRRLPD
jgi:hypothetical protein